jgi:hypothetical protein
MFKTPSNEMAYQAGRRAGFEYRETRTATGGPRPSGFMAGFSGASEEAYNLGVGHGHSEASRLDGKAWPEVIGHFW